MQTRAAQPDATSRPQAGAIPALAATTVPGVVSSAGADGSGGSFAKRGGLDNATPPGSAAGLPYQRRDEHAAATAPRERRDALSGTLARAVRDRAERGHDVSRGSIGCGCGLCRALVVDAHAPPYHAVLRTPTGCAAPAGGALLLRSHDLSALAVGTSAMLDGNGPKVSLTIVADGTAAQDRPPEGVTAAEFVKLEAAWERFLGDGTSLLTTDAGLQMRDAAIVDTTYTGSPTAITPKHGLAAGRPGTAERQATTIVARIASELCRSAAARELFTRLAENADPKQVIRLYLGKHSVGFYDSAEDFGLDIDHEKYLPEDPVPLDGKLAGVTRGELLMHVLEERWHMVYEGDGYLAAHAKCLQPNSLQNQYRRDRGIAGTSIAFPCQPYKEQGVDAALVAQLKDVAADLQDFMAIDDVGVVTRIAGLDDKLRHVGELPEPSERGTSVTKDKNYIVSEKLRGWAICVNAAKQTALTNPGSLPLGSPFEKNTGTQEAATFAQVVQMTLAAAGGGRQTTEGKDAMAKLNADWMSARKEAKAWATDKIATNKAAIENDTQTAMALMSDTTIDRAHPGNAFLLQERARRVAAVNDAMNNPAKEGTQVSHEDTNCGAVTMAVIWGTTSTGLMGEYRKLHNKAPNKFAGSQDDSAWWEELHDPWRGLEGGIPANMTNTTFQSAKGDAQWYGMRDLLGKIAKDRDAASDALRWTVEQFREPEIDQGNNRAAPVAELLAAMGAFPNGTQFCLWLYAPMPDLMMHYVYAEKFAGRLVVEDYQPNKAIKAAPPAHSYVDKMPNKSLGHFAPQYFTHGAFWALKPTVVNHKLADAVGAEDVEWRRLVRVTSQARKWNK